MRAALLRCLLPACAVVGVLLAGAVRTHAAVGTPQPPVALHTVPDAVAGATTLSHTQSVYVSHCGGCHGIEGISGPTFVPTLRNSVGSFACTPEGRAYLVRVPGVSMSLIRDDQTLADVMNFVLITLGGAARPLTLSPIPQPRCMHGGRTRSPARILWPRVRMCWSGPLQPVRTGRALAEC